MVQNNACVVVFEQYALGHITLQRVLSTFVDRSCAQVSGAMSGAMDIASIGSISQTSSAATSLTRIPVAGELGAGHGLADHASTCCSSAPAAAVLPRSLIDVGRYLRTCEFRLALGSCSMTPWFTRKRKNDLAAATCSHGRRGA